MDFDAMPKTCIGRRTAIPCHAALQESGNRLHVDLSNPGLPHNL